MFNNKSPKFFYRKKSKDFEDSNKQLQKYIKLVKKLRTSEQYFEALRTLKMAIDLIEHMRQEEALEESTKKFLESRNISLIEDAKTLTSLLSKNVQMKNESISFENKHFFENLPVDLDKDKTLVDCHAADENTYDEERKKSAKECDNGDTQKLKLENRDDGIGEIILTIVLFNCSLILYRNAL